MNDVTVGIASIGYYVPPLVHDADWIAAASGIPADVVRNKFGIHQVRRAGAGDSVSAMGVKAARDCLGGFDPAALDMVVYCGSEYKDYYLFNCAAQMAYELGATNAAVFEVHNLCSGGVWSLKVLKAMMIQDPALRHVLLISSSREGDLIDYQDTQSRFMFNFGDGAAAALLERGCERNVIMESAMIVDGRFAKSVSLPSVGCEAFTMGDAPTPIDRHLRVSDAAQMKHDLDPITFDNFVAAIGSAARRSGFEAIDFLASIFMKRSILAELLSRFGLTEANTHILEEYGHCQSADCFIALARGEAAGALKPGDRAVLVSAGTGYTWAATAVRWGSPRG